jgi:hypothetical protein
LFADAQQARPRGRPDLSGAILTTANFDGQQVFPRIGKGKKCAFFGQFVTSYAAELYDGNGLGLLKVTRAGGWNEYCIGSLSVSFLANFITDQTSLFCIS